MSASVACKPQQGGFFSRIRLRKDSVIGSPSGSATPSLAPSLASLSQDNDNLASINARLQTRNQELMQQSELNQLLFQQTSEELTAKISELVELKDAFHSNAEATKETIQVLGQQLQTLTEQLAELQDKATEHEAQLFKQSDGADNTATDSDTQLADSEEQQHQLSLEAAHVQSPTQEDVDDLIWAKLQDKNKTIHFLRCRQAKSDKRIQKLKERLEVEQSVGRDWVETIIMVNMKVRARAAAQAEADADVDV